MFKYGAVQNVSIDSNLDDVDTLESSDPAWGMLVSIVPKTELAVAIIAPAIDLQTRDKLLYTCNSKSTDKRNFSVCLQSTYYLSANIIFKKLNLTYKQFSFIFS